MVLKNLIDVDYINYKKPSMVLGFPRCSFKCCTEYGQQICQNSALANSPDIEVDYEEVITRYLKSSSKALVIQGLEPFDSWDDLRIFIGRFRARCTDDIVIYTGYNRAEIGSIVRYLKQFPNIIIKFGRYIPNQQPHYDEVLGVNLASDNQYAEKIS